MEQKRERKINYMIANNIRCLFNDFAHVKTEEQIEVVDKKSGEKVIETVIIRPNSREGLMRKFNINARTFNAIVNNKIFVNPPKIKELKGVRHLNNAEIDLICSSYIKMRDGFEAKVIVDSKELTDADGNKWNEPVYDTQLIPALDLKQKDLISTLNKNLQPTFGYELGYLKIYRVLVNNNIIIKKGKENNE